MTNDNFIFFWGHTSKIVNKACLSQWYVAPFEIDGKRYICAEQYMMEQKASSTSLRFRYWKDVFRKPDRK